jgi:hypothetical protein
MTHRTTPRAARRAASPLDLRVPAMDVLVLLEETDGAPTDGGSLAHVLGVPAGAGAMQPLARVHSVRSVAPWDGHGHDVVTLFGHADAQALALALAAVVEGRDGTRGPGPQPDLVRHLDVFAGAGARGDAAWRDRQTGQLRSVDVVIPESTLAATATRLLAESGPAIRRMVAGLAMAEWPEGMRRALHACIDDLALATAPVEGLLEGLREADGFEEE